MGPFNERRRDLRRAEGTYSNEAHLKGWILGRATEVSQSHGLAYLRKNKAGSSVHLQGVAHTRASSAGLPRACMTVANNSIPQLTVAGGQGTGGKREFDYQSRVEEANRGQGAFFG
jgi:hypothetical protein